MREPGELRCPRCEEPVEPGQEYCLECGGRLARIVPRPLTGRSAPRAAMAGTWLLPSLLGLVIAAAGTGGAFALSSATRETTTVWTAIGGAPTVTGETETLTAPEPAETAASPPARSVPPAAARPVPRNPAVATWPRGRRGWTIVLLSLPQANGRDDAAAKAQEARRAGLRRVGILDSSRYASLHPGYYVIFTGVFESQAEAVGSLQRARAVFPAAYQREIVP